MNLRRFALNSGVALSAAALTACSSVSLNNPTTAPTTTVTTPNLSTGIPATPNSIYSTMTKDGDWTSCQGNGAWGIVSGRGNTLAWVKDNRNMVGQVDTAGKDASGKNVSVTFVVENYNTPKPEAFLQAGDGLLRRVPAEKANFFLGQPEKTAKVCANVITLAKGLKLGEGDGVEASRSGQPPVRVEVAAPLAPPDRLTQLLRSLVTAPPQYSR